MRRSEGPSSWALGREAVVGLVWEFCATAAFFFGWVCLSAIVFSCYGITHNIFTYIIQLFGGFGLMYCVQALAYPFDAGHIAPGVTLVRFLLTTFQALMSVYRGNLREDGRYLIFSVGKHAAQAICQGAGALGAFALAYAVFPNSVSSLGRPFSVHTDHFGFPRRLFSSILGAFIFVLGAIVVYIYTKDRKTAQHRRGRWTSSPSRHIASAFALAIAVSYLGSGGGGVLFWDSLFPSIFEWLECGSGNGTGAAFPVCGATSVCYTTDALQLTFNNCRTDFIAQFCPEYGANLTEFNCSGTNSTALDAFFAGKDGFGVNETASVSIFECAVNTWCWTEVAAPTFLAAKGSRGNCILRTFDCTTFVDAVNGTFTLTTEGQNLCVTATTDKFLGLIGHFLGTILVLVFYVLLMGTTIVGDRVEKGLTEAATGRNLDDEPIVEIDVAEAAKSETGALFKRTGGHAGKYGRRER